MTHPTTLKSRTQDRMTRTGEDRAAARAAIVEDLRHTQPPRSRHDQTFALRRVLAGRGYEVAATGAAPTESWLLGLGGGVGVQVFTFQYKDVPPLLYVGTRCAHQYAYDAGFMERALSGLGLSAEVDETGSVKKAEQALRGRLEAGPVVAWVGLEALRGAAAPAGATPWVVVVHDGHEGPDGWVYVVEDANVGFIELSSSHLAAARKAVKKARHRLLVPVGSAATVTPTAIRAAVARCVAELDGAHAVRGYGSNFGLSALERWAKAADNGSKTGWRQIFAPGADLLVGRVQAHGWIDRATGGGAFRAMYAEFLAEAAAVLADDRLTTAARAVAQTSAAWTDLAGLFVDPSDPVMAQARERIESTGWPLSPSALTELAELAAELPPDWGTDFYPVLAARLTDLLALERHARASLAAVE